MERYGKLIIIAEGSGQYEGKKKRRTVICKCDCGGRKEVLIRRLRRGDVTTCGECSKREDLVWKTFGSLTVVAEEESVERNYNNKTVTERKFSVVCECGNNPVYNLSRVKSGKPCNECSVKKVDSQRRKIYNVFRDINRRCTLQTNKDYDSYGGRGIENEFKSFENFYNWCIENNYRQDLEIDRKDNDGNYSPENCQLITSEENKLKTKHFNLTVNDVIFIRSKYFNWEQHRGNYSCADRVIKNIIEGNTFKRVTYDNRYLFKTYSGV